MTKTAAAVKAEAAASGSGRSDTLASLGFNATVLVGLYLSSLYSYLLFHSLIEIITVVVASALFVLAWNTRKYFANGFLKTLGVGYFFCALIDLAHTLSFNGMHVFQGDSANVSIQLWIAARYLQAGTLALALLLRERQVNDGAILAAFSAAAGLLFAAVLGGFVPDCYHEGRGLTEFKIRSEYVIAFVLAISLAVFWRSRKHFEARVARLVLFSIVFTIFSELSFTRYVSTFGIANAVGHYFKLAAFYFVYRSILVTGLQDPFAVVFRGLRQTQEALRRSVDELEERVRERTADLQLANSELETRVAQRTSQLSLANERMRAEIVEREKAQAERDTVIGHLHQAQKLEAVGQLAAGIAHEINTPTQFVSDNIHFLEDSFQSIAAALGCYDELLSATRNNQVSPELIARIETSLTASDLTYLRDEVPAAIRAALEGAGRISTIVRAMKEFAHPGSTERLAADLNRAIETTTTVARNEWKHVAELELDLDPDLPPVPCFISEFNQCVLNLVVNAAHAIGDAQRSKPGSRGRITVRSRQDDGYVEVRVEDTGTGIPEAIRHRVFDPFFTTKTVGAGTGQGLSMVYGTVVKKHGGTVTFETEVGKGTVFVVRLPIAAAA